MKTKIFLSLAGLAMLVSVYGQQTISLKDGKLTDKILPTVPERDIQVTDSGVTVTYFFSAAILLKDELYKGSYWWKMDGFGLNETPGEPSTLSRTDMIGIPNGKTAIVEILESEYKDFQYTLTPAHPALTNSGNELYTKENVKPIDISLGVIPKEIIVANGVDSYRGRRILNVRVSPIQYIPESKTVRAYSRIKYRVVFANDAQSYVPENLLPDISRQDHFLSNVLLNGSSYAYVSDTGWNREDYLIISIPGYADAVNTFADWKRKMGFTTHVELQEGWTPAGVKRVVQSYYEKYRTLHYLLIVGDHEDVPAVWSSNGPHTHVTDLYYGCMDADTIPDINYGRIPVDSLSEALTVINKIIQYEKNPITDNFFYRNGLNCAYFQDRDSNGYADRRFAQTSEDVRNYLIGQGKTVTRVYCAKNNVNPLFWNNDTYSNGESIPTELLRSSGFLWNGNYSNIKNAINNGVFYVLHRDHGDINRWVDPYFSTAHISQLSNGNKLPVVFSLNCKTGKFNGQTCFCESFLKKQNGGCVAIYGATNTSYSGYNDVLTGGMFDAIWPNPGLFIKMPEQSIQNIDTLQKPIYQLGAILNQGKKRMNEIYGSAYYDLYTRELFHCFGDPSMHIYTDKPTPIGDVTYSTAVNKVDVSLPNDSATIVFHNFVSGDVITYIGRHASYKTPTPSFVSVYVSGHNRIPRVIWTGLDPTPDLYFQNETIQSDNRITYVGVNIKAGNHVTDSLPHGDVIFRGGPIYLYGHEVQLQPGTRIAAGTEMHIITQ